MTITLNTPKEVTIIPAEVKTVTTLTIERMVDLPQEKIVRVFINELNQPIILWEGDAYDLIGQWSDSDVEAKLLEIFSA